MNLPGDQAEARDKVRPAIDWGVLAMMIADLGAAFWIAGPWIREQMSRPFALAWVIGFSMLIWMGPFLGVLRGRGRTSALVCYALGKGILSLLPVASWWGGLSVVGGAAPMTNRVLCWCCWHTFGMLLCITAMFAGRHRPAERSA